MNIPNSNIDKNSMIVAGGDVQKSLSETITNEQGDIKPKNIRDNPLKLRAGKNNFLRQDVNVWSGKDVGRLVEMFGVPGGKAHVKNV